MAPEYSRIFNSYVVNRCSTGHAYTQSSINGVFWKGRSRRAGIRNTSAINRVSASQFLIARNFKWRMAGLEQGVCGALLHKTVGGFGEAWVGSMGSVSSIVWMTDALQGQ